MWLPCGAFQRAELEPPSLCRVQQDTLSKRDIEELLDSYDLDPVRALTRALVKIVKTHDGSWDSIVGQIPDTIAAHDRLRGHDIASLDAVVKHLVEHRRLQK